MTQFEIIILAPSYLLSGLIVYSSTFRIASVFRTSILLISLTTTLSFLIAGERSPFIYGFITLPSVIYSTFILANRYAYKKHGRRFYLKARGSGDITTLGLSKHNPHLKLSDKVFSALIILLWLGWPILFMVIAGVFSRQSV